MKLHAVCDMHSPAAVIVGQGVPGRRVRRHGVLRQEARAVAAGAARRRGDGPRGARAQASRETRVGRTVLAVNIPQVALLYD